MYLMDFVACFEVFDHSSQFSSHFSVFERFLAHLELILAKKFVEITSILLERVVSARGADLCCC